MSTKKLNSNNIKSRKVGDSSIVYNSKKGLCKISMVYSSPNSYFDSEKTPELHDIIIGIGLSYKEKKEEHKVIYVSEDKCIIRVEGIDKDLITKNYIFLRNEKIKNIIDKF